TGHVVGPVAYAYIFQQLVRALLDGCLFLARGSVARDGSVHTCAGSDVAPYHDVLDSAEAAEQTYVLEGACQPDNGDLVRLQARKLMPHEIAVARLRPIQTGQYVEKRRLARPVGTDKAVDVALAD